MIFPTTATDEHVQIVVDETGADDAEKGLSCLKTLLNPQKAHKPLSNISIH